MRGNCVVPTLPTESSRRGCRDGSNGRLVRVIGEDSSERVHTLSIPVDVHTPMSLYRTRDMNHVYMLVFSFLMSLHTSIVRNNNAEC